jgi:hypothetical protein
MSVGSCRDPVFNWTRIIRIRSDIAAGLVFSCKPERRFHPMLCLWEPPHAASSRSQALFLATRLKDNTARHRIFALTMPCQAYRTVPVDQVAPVLATRPGKRPALRKPSSEISNNNPRCLAYGNTCLQPHVVIASGEDERRLSLDACVAVPSCSSRYKLDEGRR